MARKSEQELTRRERQIMDVVYRLEAAAVSDVVDGMPDPPSYSAVRALMNVLVDKGELRRRRDGVRFLYVPTRRRSTAARSALQRTVKTFFGGSPEKAVAALLDMSSLELTEEELRELMDKIEQASKKP